MLYCTVNLNKVKRTLIVLIVFTAAALMFCMWALLVHGNHKLPEGGQAISSSDTEQPLITVISFSDAEASISTANTSLTFASQPTVPAYANLSPFSLNQSVFLPLDSAFVTSKFGFRDHPINGKYAFHSGLDLAAPEGSPIYAMLDGTVSLAGYDAGYGNYIILDHEDGVQTLYAHCLLLNVHEGDAVTRGTPIAQVGATGSATGPHLHVELRYNGQRYDPAYILGEYYS